MKGIQIKIPETENLCSPFQGQLSMLTKIVELFLFFRPVRFQKSDRFKQRTKAYLKE